MTDRRPSERAQARQTGVLPAEDLLSSAAESASYLTTAETDMSLLPLLALSRPSVLQQVRGPGAPQVFELEREVLTLGRADDVDLVIPSSALSRRHMRIERHLGGHRVIDLDSSNGVYLNEVRIYSALLRDGDALQLGNTVFIYHEGK